jgi:hypothetical protein
MADPYTLRPSYKTRYFSPQYSDAVLVYDLRWFSPVGVAYTPASFLLGFILRSRVLFFYGFRIFLMIFVTRVSVIS